MSCALDIDDIVAEMAKDWTIGPIAGLPADQVAGVLTAVIKTVEQDSYVATTAKGLGSYGLSLADLQLTGIVKCGFDFDADILVALSDPSIFTGKKGVNSVIDLTGPTPTSCESVTAELERKRAEGLQQSLMHDVIVRNMNSLSAQGYVTDDQSDQELANLAGQSSKFAPFEVIGNILGTVGDVLSYAADSLGALAALGALIAVVKNADILGKLKGFGAQIASIPELLTNTISMADTDAGADSIVGSSKIASIASGVGDTLFDAGKGLASEYIGKYI